MIYFKNYDSFITESENTVQIGKSSWKSSLFDGLFTSLFSKPRAKTKIKTLASEYNDILLITYNHYLNNVRGKNQNNEENTNDNINTDTESNTESNSTSGQAISKDMLDLINKIKSNEKTVNWNEVTTKVKNFKNIFKMTSDVLLLEEQFENLKTYLKNVIGTQTTILSKLKTIIKNIDTKIEEQDWSNLDEEQLKQYEIHKEKITKEEQYISEINSFLKTYENAIKNKYPKKANETYTFSNVNNYYNIDLDAIKRDDWTKEDITAITNILNAFRLKEVVYKKKTLIESFSSDNKFQKELEHIWDGYIIEIKKNWNYIYDVNRIEESTKIEDSPNKQILKQTKNETKNSLILDELFKDALSMSFRLNGALDLIKWSDDCNKFDYFILSIMVDDNPINIFMRKCYLDLANKPNVICFKLLKKLKISNGKLVEYTSLKNAKTIEVKNNKLQLFLDSDGFPLVQFYKNYIYTFDQSLAEWKIQNNFDVKPLSQNEYMNYLTNSRSIDKLVSTNKKQDIINIIEKISTKII